MEQEEKEKEKEKEEHVAENQEQLVELVPVLWRYLQIFVCYLSISLPPVDDAHLLRLLL